MGVAYLGHRLHPDALDQLGQEIDRRADFRPYGVEIGGLRALDWIAVAIDRRPDWKLAA